MEIEVVWGVGVESTRLGAVDAALAAAGIHNYNLVTYSSILPPDATVTAVGTHDGRYGVGTPVPVVLARYADTTPGSAAAGLGWQTATDGGVIYEAIADSERECRVRLMDGLSTARELRDWQWDTDPEHMIIEEAFEGTGAIVVAAVYPPDSRDRGPVA